MIIAFGTTVLGLATGLIGYVITMVRSRWYEQEAIWSICPRSCLARLRVKLKVFGRKRRSEKNEIFEAKE